MLVMFTIIFLEDYIEDDKVVVVLGKNEGLDERKGQVCSSLEKEGEIPTSPEFKRPNLTTTIIVKLLGLRFKDRVCKRNWSLRMLCFATHQYTFSEVLCENKITELDIEE